jgi:capsular polysaccharide biosynthesis protein
VQADHRAEAAGDGLVSFSDYVHVLRRRKAFLLLGLLVGLLAGLGYSSGQPKTYSSTASVEVRSVPAIALSGSGSGNSNVNISTETQVAVSTAVAQRVISALHLNVAPAHLLSRTKVSVPAKSDVLQITYVGSTPESTQRTAQAFADSYLSERRDQTTELAKMVTLDLQRRIRALQTQLLVVQTTLATTTRGSSANTNALAQQNILTQQLSPLRARLDQVQSIVIDPGTVIVPAGPGHPTGMSTGVVAAAGALIGLVIGTLLAFLRDLSDSLVREAADVESVTGVPVFGALPSPFGAGGTLVLLDGQNPRQRAYAALAARLFVVARRDNARSIVVTAPQGEREAVAVAANVAVAIAQSDTRVALVTEDTAALPDLSAVPKLSVVPLRSLTGGTRLADPSRTRTLISALEEVAELVVVAAPELHTADSLVLSSVADAVILVATQKVTRTKAMAAAIERLDELNARLLGVTLIGFSRGSRRRTSVSRPPAADAAPEREAAAVGPVAAR